MATLANRVFHLESRGNGEAEKALVLSAGNQSDAEIDRFLDDCGIVRTRRLSVVILRRFSQATPIALISGGGSRQA